MGEHERIGREKGWYVTEALDGLWYVCAWHGDPDARGEFYSEEDAWAFAAKECVSVNEAIANGYPDA